MAGNGINLLRYISAIIADRREGLMGRWVFIDFTKFVLVHTDDNKF